MRRSWIGCLLMSGVIGTALAITPIAAQDDHEAARKKLRALRQAAEVLEDAGMGEEAERLMLRHGHLRERLQHARGRRQERARGERHNGEREIAQRLVRAMRLGVNGLSKTDRERAAHNLEHALHARQLNLEGRRDEEAAEIRRTAPGVGQQAELMALAANVLRQQGRLDDADVVAQEARRLQQWQHERRQRVGNQIELMQVAQRQLLAAERVDAARIVEDGISARRMRHAGRNDEEARDIIRRQPALGHQARALLLAAELLADRGQADHAHQVAQLGRQMGAEVREHRASDRQRREHGERRQRDRDERRRREHHRRGEHREHTDSEQAQRSDRIHRHLEELGGRLEKLSREMEKRMQELRRALEELEATLDRRHQTHEL